jgi:riboflavin biosynthesis pyrimidine reductase
LKSLYTTFHIGSILAECGGNLMSNFLQFGVLDELHVFIAPIIIGNGISAFNSIESNLLRDSYTFSNQAVLKSDEDLHIIYTKKI